MKVSDKYITVSNVKAYVVMDKDRRLVAKIILKYPRDGAGRLNAQVESWDREHNYTNQRGYADGYGYNKANAALDGMTLDGKLYEFGGLDWQRVLEEDGYTVIEVV